MNGGNSSSDYERVKFPRKIRWSNGTEIHFYSSELSYAEGASADGVLASASDPHAIEEFAASTGEMMMGGSGPPEPVLYIIQADGEPNICKIGYSATPVFRLEQLQTAHWRKLKLTALFFPLQGKAEKLKASIHCRAERRGLTLRGEWLGVSALAATELILESARRRNDYLCGADVLRENLAARVFGLRQKQLHYRNENRKLNAA